MHLKEFDYSLPENLIAKYPATQRTASRLMCVNKKTGVIQHQQFAQIIDWLNPNDLLIINNSKVMPARLFGYKSTGGKVEILIERILSSHHAIAHMRASKSLRADTHIQIAPDCTIIVTGRQDNLFEIQSLQHDFTMILERYGHIPLPPYFNRDDEELDVERYQTVYAKTLGSVAAPTAGLHFDIDLLQSIKAKGINIAEVTLHVGAGTFQSIKVDDITQHRMHSEIATVSAKVCEQIQQTKTRNGRVIAVGTTSVRSLETAARKGVIEPFCGETNMFIYPGFDFKVVDTMITNFHLPQSTLLMLVSAFAGTELIQQAYQTAITEQYRFFSYGDAMFIF